MKNILLPTDFSENAWSAVQYAIESYKNETCFFYLLNTYTPTIVNARFMASGIRQDQLGDAAQRDSKIGLQKMLQRIRKTFNNKNHSFRTVSSFSLLVDEIQEAIEKYQIELVIIGSQGVSGSGGTCMGSNTLRIIKSIKNRPVLSVPRHYLLAGPKRIAFMTDLNRLYSSLELYPIIDMARTFNTSVYIVHLQDEIVPLSELQKYILGMLKSYLKQVDHSVHILGKTVSDVGTFEAFQKKMDINLMVLVNNQLGCFEKGTCTSWNGEAIFHLKIPLLVLPELVTNAPTTSLKLGGNTAVLND
ncbi:universal stress protein [Flavobacteriaceae bacterium F89]|uniref:Universal stress protein n=1 Tax=Cerina litoralis TaxID=2874477 RepID=A0AAE3JSP3_9FLAO|nr:universal stress protein [Cerina litoralis]MCG2462733.1 universal stress protein [Cerina litoralis]